MSQSPLLNLDYLTQGQALGEVTTNEALNDLETFALGRVLDRDLAAQPSSPNNGDAYIVASGATGTDWSGQDGNIAYYYTGWFFVSPVEGMRFWIADEDLLLIYDGTSWIENPISSLGGLSSLTLTAQSPPGHSAGLLFYNSDDESLSFYNNESDVLMSVGQETWIQVYNDTGSTITNGQAVYISGNNVGTGLPTIALARADASSTADVAGLATHDIENNSIGYVTALGVVKDLNTNAFNNGDKLYLSASTAGALTATAPSRPNRVVEIGYVTSKNVSTGTVLVELAKDAGQLFDIVDDTTPQLGGDLDTNGNTIVDATNGYINVVGAGGTLTLPVIDADTTAVFSNGGASDAWLSILAASSNLAGINLGSGSEEDTCSIYRDTNGGLNLSMSADSYWESSFGTNTIYFGAGVPDDIDINLAGGQCRLATGAIMGPLATGGNPVTVTDGLTWYDTTLNRLQVYSDGAYRYLNTMDPIIIRPQQLFADGTDPFGLTTRNTRVLAAFDDTADEIGYYSSVTPKNYQGDGLSVFIYWVAETATSGVVEWAAAFERVGLTFLDTDADGFAADQTQTTTANSTNGRVMQTKIDFTAAQADALQDGEPFRLRIKRNGSSGSDTMTGDAQIYAIQIAGLNDY